MLKKSVKITAAAMSLVMLLTGCSSAEGNLFIDEYLTQNRQEYESYVNAPITQEESRPFTVNGKEGLYSGYWKGNRPEGNGELIVSEDEYYKGEWKNGFIAGQGEMKKTDDDGIAKQYTGECAYNQPSGEGLMFVGTDGEAYRLMIEGDFGDESSLMYFLTDDKGKLLDLGGFINGNIVSCVENPESFEGIPFEDIYWEQVPNDFYWSSSSTKGKYVGQTDENGVPNGYGYSETYVVNVSGGYNNRDRKIGTWKNGKIEGYYTNIQEENSANLMSTTEFDGFVKIKREGAIKDGVGAGEYVSYERAPINGHGEGTLINRTNYDDYLTFSLCSDGKYRTGYWTKEYYYEDGTRGYEKTRRRLGRLDTNPWVEYQYAYYEGEYGWFDANGNITDYGVATDQRRNDYILGSLRWESYKNKRQNEFLDSVAAAGGALLSAVVIGAGIYALLSWGDDFESTSAGKYLENVRERNSAELEDYNTNMEQFRELKSKAESIRRRAESETGYRRNDLLAEADRVESEAWSHHRSIF